MHISPLRFSGNLPETPEYDLLREIVERANAGDAQGARQLVKDSVEINKTEKPSGDPGADVGEILKRTRKQKKISEKSRERLEEASLDKSHLKILHALREFVQKPSSEGMLSNREFLQVFYANAKRRQGLSRYLTLGALDNRYVVSKTLYNRFGSGSEKSQVKEMVNELREIAGAELFGDALSEVFPNLRDKFKIHDDLMVMIKKVLEE